MPTKRLLTLASLTLLSAFPLSAAAQEEITIQDTQGFTRAVSEVDRSGDVSFDLINRDGVPPDGVEVTLANAATGETLTAVSASGAVVFHSISPGVWTVATTVPGITFTNAAVTAAGAMGAAAGGTAAAVGLGGFGGAAAGTTAVVVGGGVVAAGATAIAVANADDDDDDPISPSR